VSGWAREGLFATSFDSPPLLKPLKAGAERGDRGDTHSLEARVEAGSTRRPPHDSCFSRCSARCAHRDAGNRGRTSGARRESARGAAVEEDGVRRWGWRAMWRAASGGRAREREGEGEGGWERRSPASSWREEARRQGGRMRGAAACTREEKEGAGWWGRWWRAAAGWGGDSEERARPQHPRREGARRAADAGRRGSAGA
jgi:hypothetical protein